MKTLPLLAVLVFGGLCSAPALAQHEHHAPPVPAVTPTPAPQPGSHEHGAPVSPTAAPAPVETPHPGHSKAPPPQPGEHGQMEMAMNMDEKPPERNLFQSDMALMTGMTPRDPMAGMAMPGWHLMVLGVARLSYNHQGGRSGDNAVESSNWNMFHLAHDLGGGRLSLMMMNSLEPWTFEKRGSPELFQTGEAYRGRPLVDRQHPHDFFMNLSATYRLPLGSDGAAWLQLAPVGEPAIGPTAFMHRASSGENPTAPLGHHWQDSTHIAFNVATLGAGWKAVSVEGSVFHGSEPDEHRWDIEGGRIDSAAGRVKLFLPEGWSAQVSHAFLHEPEAAQPGDLHRTTASLHYGAEGDRPFAATLLWGRDDETHGVSDSVLLEAAYQLTRSDQIYGRAEWVEKDRRLLEFKGAEATPAIDVPEVARIGALTVGYLRDFVLARALRVGAGADLTAYSSPSGLKRVYGSSPLSYHVFLRVRWGQPHGGTEHSGMTMGHS
ncbi:MAG TPA: hypothetical protein VGK86_07900, partial [Thermoanaerobaculia bacterium]